MDAPTSFFSNFSTTTTATESAAPQFAFTFLPPACLSTEPKQTDDEKHFWCLPAVSPDASNSDNEDNHEYRTFESVRRTVARRHPKEQSKPDVVVSRKQPLKPKSPSQKQQTDLATSLLQKLTLECPICSDQMADPRMLPCLHTICAACIGDCIADAKDKDKAPECFVCHENFPADINLAINLAISPQKPVISVSYESSTPSIVGSSNSGDLVDVCESCVEKTLASSFCSFHLCNKLLCSSCVPLHKDHDILSIELAYDHLKQLLSVNSLHIHQEFSKLDGAMFQLLAFRLSLESRSDRIIGEITREFDEIILKVGSIDPSWSGEELTQRSSELQLRRDKLIALARAETSSDLKTTILQHENLQAFKESLQTALRITTNLLVTDAAPITKLLQARKVVTERLDLLKRGQLTLTPVSSSLIEFVMPKLHNVWVPPANLGFVGRFRNYSAIESAQVDFTVNFENIIAISSTPSGDFILITRAELPEPEEKKRSLSSLIVLSSHGTFIRRVDLINKVSAIAVVPTTNCFVVVSENQLQLLEPDGQSSLSIPTPFQANSLAVASDGKSVFAAGYAAYLAKFCLVTGACIWIRQFPFSNVTHTTVLQWGGLVFSTFNNRVIQVTYSSTGEACDWQRVETQRSINYMGMTMDGHFVVIGDEELSVINFHGYLVHTLKRSSLWEALVGATILPDNRIAILQSCWDDDQYSISIF